MRTSLAFCILFALAVSAWAQDRTISGKVVSNENWTPVPGVNVVLKGTAIGTATDADGVYTLSINAKQLSVESLAEDMGMSRVQLYRKISGLTDISVNELIRKLRLQRAAQLLQQNWGPVSQVAYEVGFSNLSYFSKVFKEEFGVLPSEYLVKEK